MIIATLQLRGNVKIQDLTPLHCALWMNREYFLEIEEGTIAYVYFKTTKGEVAEFVVKLLIEFEGRWHEVVSPQNRDRTSRK
ncbi:MAG: DUF7718 family protein [Nitrospirota bacterium]